MARTDAGPRTILVVDDDINVRTVIGTVLRRQKFDVIEAATGEDALRMADQCGTPIQLVISDLNMPQMGGRALLDQLRTMCPSIRLLLISGEDQPSEPSPRAGHPPISFLAKPFTPAQLSAAVKGLLDGANGGAT